MENNLLSESSHSKTSFSPLRAPSSLPIENSSKPAPITINNNASKMELNNIRPETYGASYGS